MNWVGSDLVMENRITKEDYENLQKFRVWIELHDLQQLAAATSSFTLYWYQGENCSTADINIGLKAASPNNYETSETGFADRRFSP